MTECTYVGSEQEKIVRVLFMVEMHDSLWINTFCALLTIVYLNQCFIFSHRVELKREKCRKLLICELLKELLSLVAN